MNLDAQLAQVIRAAVNPMLSASLDQLEARLVERLAELVRPQPVPVATVPPPLMTLNDVADHLQVAARTVQRRVAAGDFPRPVMVGPTCPRWRREDLDAWLAAQGGQG